MRTTIVTKHQELDKHLGSLDAGTHLMSKTGPPNNDKDPDFVKDWDISVLMSPVIVNA